MRKLGWWTASVVVVVLLAGCGSPHKGASPQTSNTTSSATASSSTSGPTTTMATPIPATTTPTTASAQFAAAKSEWNEGSCNAAAVQSMYWLAAATDLQQGETQSGSTTSDTAIADLKQLATLPDMGLTSAQVTESQSDTNYLNSFFGTPGLYGDTLGNCPSS